MIPAAVMAERHRIVDSAGMGPTGKVLRHCEACVGVPSMALIEWANGHANRVPTLLIVHTYYGQEV